jgi:hypothetical protein
MKNFQFECCTTQWPTGAAQLDTAVRTAVVEHMDAPFSDRTMIIGCRPI